MILYHVSTMYHLLRCIVHKLARHPDEECRLLVVEYVLANREDVGPMIDWLRQQGWFTRIDIVPEREFKLKRNAALTEESTPEEIEAVAGRISGHVERWLGEDVRKYDRIYVAADHWSFGIHLLYQRIPYVFWEDASGMLSEEERYRRIIKAVNLTNYVISEHYGGIGRSDLVDEKLCDMGNQQPGFFDPKAVHFSVYDTLCNEIPDQVGSLLRFYRVSPIQISGKVCLFLTQYTKTLAIKEIYVQEILTTLLIDYVCPEHVVVVKPHPKDHYIDYQRLLGKDCVVLPNEFPSEILPFVLEAEIDLALTASSTSIGGMKRYVQQSYTFGTAIERYWEDLHPMAAAVQLLCHLGFTHVAIQGMDPLQMENLLQREGISPDGAQALIHGGLDGTEIGGTEAEFPVAIQLNLRGECHYPDTIPAGRLLCVTVAVEPERESNLRRREYPMFVGCREEALYQKIAGFSYQRTLRNSRALVRVSAAPITPEAAQYWKLRKAAETEWRKNHETESSCLCTGQAE